ncbi:hypothetical protein MMC28_011210 [Mycoblastus sanguinarius]|nr:hypothetical protein [Mycoblastus sanguinarius]
MDAFDKFAIKTNRNQERIEEDITVIKKAVTEISSTSSRKTWSSVVSSLPGGVQTVHRVPKPKPAINKETEIIVRLNDNEKNQKLQETATQDTCNDINTKIAELETSSQNIRAITQLPSGDIAIYTIIEEEATK